MKAQYCSLYLFDTVRTCCSPLYEITSSNHDVSCLRKHDLVVDGGMRVVWDRRVSVRVLRLFTICILSYPTLNLCVTYSN